MEKIFNTIDVNAKEWYDKVNGNSYFSCRVTFDFGTATQREFVCPFQYGYGNAYETAAENVVKTIFPSMPPTLRELRGMAVVRSDIQRGCLKKDLVRFSAKDIGRIKEMGVTCHPFYETIEHSDWPKEIPTKKT